MFWTYYVLLTILGNTSISELIHYVYDLGLLHYK